MGRAGAQGIRGDDHRLGTARGPVVTSLASREWRNWFRATAAHNTVVVDGEDSSEVWDSFRVARRARPFDVAWGLDADKPWLTAAHDGYRRLPGRVTHRRKWILDRGALSIEDSLDGRFTSAVAMLRFHPDAAASSICVRCEPPVDISVEPSTWHPEFGKTRETTLLTLPLSAPSTTARLIW